MLNLIKPIPIYIKLYTDKVEITRLDTDTTNTRLASEKFSNARLVVANFYHAEQLTRAVIKELISSKFLQPTLKILIQQMDKNEGGLSDVEKRVLRDLGEFVGGSLVKIVEQQTALTTAEALLVLSEK